MPMDKRQPYETDIRVPLLISGPGIEPSTISAPVSSVDIFATLLNIAGVKYPSDGTTLFNANRNLSPDRTVLIEYRGEKSSKPSSSGCPSDSDLNVTASFKFFLICFFKLLIVLIVSYTFLVMCERNGVQVSGRCEQYVQLYPSRFTKFQQRLLHL